MTSRLIRMCICNTSVLRLARRDLVQRLHATAANAGVAVTDARAVLHLFIGPREWATLAASVRAHRPTMQTNFFDHLEACLSEAHSRHRDDDPAVIIVATLDVLGDPGPDVQQGLIEVDL